ncbi:MAG: MFS transporter [Thermodesulfobacteriota bacterium]|nr:MFS transporter [Thermodesulfobacteriota bacterium]
MSLISKPAPATPENNNSRLAWRIGTATLCRLLLNTARRFPYPFAPALGRGMGVSLEAVTSLIAVNQLSSILSPLFGPAGDKWGYRRMLLAGMGLLAAGMLVAGFLPFYGVVMVALFMAGLGKSIFDPAIQAYAGQHVPFHRRGLVIGIMETAWAGSSLIGIPVAGFMIAHLGWRSPFFLLGGLGLAGIVAIAILVPDGRQASRSAGKQTGYWVALRQLGREKAALKILGFAFFISAANDNFFVVYGAWLEDAFKLDIVTLGMTTIVIGVAELSGEGLTSFLADRLGLRRSVIIGLFLSGVSYMALPLIGDTFCMAMATLFVVFIAVEFSIVSFLSLCTEVLPGARATMMSGVLAAAGLGRVAGALIGGPVWMAGGIWAVGSVSAFISVLAMGSLLWGLNGWSPEKH